MNRAGKAAKAAPYVKAKFTGRNTGEYAAYLTGSNTPFVIMCWAL